MQPRSTGGYQEMAGRITRYQHRATEQAPGAPHRDIGLTRKWMNSIGVDVACVFPTPMLGLGLNPVVEVEVQYARAYNRWLTEKILAHEPRMVSMLYLPMNDPVAALKMVEEFSGRKGVIGFLITTVRYKPLYDNAYMKLYARAGRARPAARLPFGDELGRPEHAHLEQVHRDPRAGLLVVQHPAHDELGRERHSGALPQAQVDLDRERPRLGAVRDAAPRQRIHDALVGDADAQAPAERLHARDVSTPRSRWRWSTTTRCCRRRSR